MTAGACAHPLGARTEAPAAGARYEFLAAEGEGLHQIPVGPVHAGIIEPGHFRFTANGETVVRLEERLGYVHKGIEGLMAGADLAKGAMLAGRTSGDSTVAYGIAFARAAEAALDIEAPPRAQWLRALMAELERLANHFGDIGAICNDASFSLMHAHCGVLRELVLRAADTSFGHRLMRDIVRPGGIARDIGIDGIAAVRAVIGEIRRRFPALIELYDNTTSLQDRTVSTGILKPGLARQFGAGGYVGRASGRAFDARRSVAYPPYDQLQFEVPVLEEGDVNARVWIRIREIEQSLALIDQILGRLPDGPIHVEIDAAGAACEGLALVEGFRGDILVCAAPGERRADRALPPARSLLVPMAAAGSGDRGQHRRGLPALQQVVQLLLLRARSLEDRQHAQAPPGRPDPLAPHRGPAASQQTRRWPNSPPRSSASRVTGWGAASPSAKWMPAPATAASWRFMRSTMRSMISSASVSASSPRPAMRMCCWSPDR